MTTTPAGDGDTRPTDRELEAACEVMHDAYEAAAVREGWKTQEASREPWDAVPKGNKATMRAAVLALFDHLAARAPAPPDAAQALRDLAESWHTRARTVADRRRPILADALDQCARELDRTLDRLAAPEPDAATRTVPVDGDVFDLARHERARAHAEHGANSMESVPWHDPTGRRLRVLVEEVGEVAKELNDAEVEGREVDAERLGGELVQVAAMAGAWADVAFRAAADPGTRGEGDDRG